MATESQRRRTTVVEGDLPNKRITGSSLSAPEGAEIFRKLVATADAGGELPPRHAGALGVGPEQLHEVNLLETSESPASAKPPYARPGFGTLAEAMSGFAHLTGEADGPPTLPAFGLADSICGIAASSAAMMALWARERGDGRGQVVDINLLQPIMTAVGPAPMVYDQLGLVEKRHGNRSTNNAPRNTYRTRDGKWVAISTSAQAIAERVMTLVGHPEVISEPWFRSGRERAKHADLLDRYVGDWIAQRDCAEVVAEFEAAGAAVAPVYDARDLVNDPHIQATEMLTRVADDDLGPMLMHNVMWRMSSTPGRIRFTGRDLGADTDDILINQLGYEPSQLAELRERKIVA